MEDIFSSSVTYSATIYLEAFLADRAVAGAAMGNVVVV
jgi:hypothetical protein